jgi:hypothetical protein
MDVSALATFLAPALPFLLGVGDDLAQRAKATLGEAVWENARRLWDRLRAKVDGDDAAKAAAEEVAARPEDPEARAAWTFLLRRMLAADPDLAAEVSRAWEDARAATIAVASGERAVALAGENQGNIIITGDRAERRSE